MTNDFFRFEDKEYDLPFLNGDSRFTTKNVIILIIGFLIAAAIPYLIPPTGNGLLKAILITFPPLLAVVYVFKDDMSNIFRIPKPIDIIIVIIGFILMFVFGILTIQILGEELIKFIPLIIVAAYLYKSIGRKAAIIVAIIISQIIFALFHIPAYGLVMGFLLVHIGFGSIVLPFVYVKTKNLVLCYLIHLLLDLWTFIPYILGM